MYTERRLHATSYQPPTTAKGDTVHPTCVVFGKKENYVAVHPELHVLLCLRTQVGTTESKQVTNDATSYNCAPPAAELPQRPVFLCYLWVL